MADVDSLSLLKVATKPVLLRRGLLVGDGFIVFWGLLLLATRLSDPNAEWRLDQLERVAAVDFTRPTTTAVSQTLPDDWLASARNSRSDWYSTQFMLPDSLPQLWAVYLPNVMMNAAVFLNDELIGREGQLTAPVTRNWSRPLLFQLPAGLLRSGSNDLRIQVVADPPGTGFLGKVYPGPINALSASYEHTYLIRVTAMQISVIGTFTMAFFMFVLFFMRPQDGVYLWFGIGLVCWTVHNLNLIISDPPFAPDTWVRLMAMMLIWNTDQTGTCIKLQFNK